MPLPVTGICTFAEAGRTDTGCEKQTATGNRQYKKVTKRRKGFTVLNMGRCKNNTLFTYFPFTVAYESYIIYLYLLVIASERIRYYRTSNTVPFCTITSFPLNRYIQLHAYTPLACKLPPIFPSHPAIRLVV